MAITKIKADYSFDEMKVNDKTIFDWMLKSDPAASVGRTTGDIDAGRKLSDTVIESEYHDVYLAHAPIETHSALAQIEGDKITVWASTQSPFGLQGNIFKGPWISAGKGQSNYTFRRRRIWRQRSI